MAITINIYYTGKDGNALKFAKEMIESGLVEQIRNEQGNLKYDYFVSLNNKDTILLVDRWIDQNALDLHHKSKFMDEIIKLRDKYDLKMKVERFKDDDVSNGDEKYIRK